ncbi:MAG: hypothetical protein Q9168_001668 [Polycauliona sp. 1 TL-2023]
MIIRESHKKPTFFVGLTIFFLLSVILMQRKHKSLSHHIFETSNVFGSNSAVNEGTTAFPGVKQTRLREASLIALQNETLGFEKVYVINLRKRTDKLDAIRLSASVTGFNFDVIEGQHASDMSPKALPGPFKDEPQHDATIGCWRSHMQAAHNIVNNRLSSALVFEDDSDWDVTFRSQLINFALGS